ncbi:hypothetical protein MSPP1_000899 [Malassezia sp. CBS 17886]|nr:hypothetical protein MSPP1_000899 [Malassezia sp. CBS 17886]
MDHDPQRAAAHGAGGVRIPADLRLSTVPEGPVMGVPAACGLLTRAELHITEAYDMHALRDALADGTHTALDVVTAFGKRAAIAHQLTNCLADWFLPEAQEHARWLDAEFQRTGRPVGPLHGVPVSVKDQVCVAGRDASAGFLSTKAPAEDDALLIRVLREQGAVPFVKTTMAQAIMHLECESFHGRTCNPYNTHLSSGGSSGGEGALLALHGSVLGIGTDIGGSIRVPAAFNGLYGYRPTAHVFSRLGVKGTMPGNRSIVGVVGPLAHSLRDCALFVDTALPSQRQDSGVHPMAWPARAGVRGRRTRVGLMADDGVVHPHAAIQRALRWMRRVLADMPDMDIVEYVPPGGTRAWELATALYFPDGGARVRALGAAACEPLHPLTRWLLAQDGVRERSMHVLWELHAEHAAFRQMFHEHWNALGLDVVIAPVYVAPGAAQNTARYWNYSSLWNVLDYPGIAFPTGLFVEPEDGAERLRTARNVAEDECIASGALTANYTGIPLGLQMVAQTDDDARLFALMAAVDRAVGGGTGGGEARGGEAGSVPTPTT